MGGFNFSIPFLVGLIAGITVIFGVISHRRSKKKGTPPPKGCYRPGCLGCSGAIALLCGLVVLAYILRSIGSFSTELSCFNRTFDIPTPADVRNLNYYTTGFVDHDEKYLKFECSYSTISLITNRFTSTTRREIEYRMTDDRQPEWWNPFANEPEHYFIAKQYSKHYWSNCAVMCYDTNTATCYFYWIGLE